MVTGDFPKTAQAIAEQIGIIDKDFSTPENTAIVNGQEI